MISKITSIPDSASYCGQVLLFSEAMGVKLCYGKDYKKNNCKIKLESYSYRTVIMKAMIRTILRFLAHTQPLWVRFWHIV